MWGVLLLSLCCFSAKALATFCPLFLAGDAQPPGIAVLGPTSVGKTAVVEQVLREVDGDAVNADEMFLYGFVTIGTGLADVHLPADRQHLYRILAPHDDYPAWPVYGSLAADAVQTAWQQGRVCVAEGCTYGLGRSWAIGAPPQRLVVALEWKSERMLRQRIERRVEQMFADGLVAEAESMITLGFANTYVATESCVYKHVFALLRGEIREAECKWRIAAHIFEVATRQRDKFKLLPNVHWIRHDPDSSSRTVDEILTEFARRR